MKNHLSHLRLLWPWCFCLCLLSCGPTPAPVVDPTPPVSAFDTKMRWILQLEDERQLRGHGGDLLTLLNDAEPRVRRRAALATGRVRLPEAIPGLTSLLQSDEDAEVRQMAAFAMGLIGDATNLMSIVKADG